MGRGGGRSFGGSHSGGGRSFGGRGSSSGGGMFGGDMSGGRGGGRPPGGGRPRGGYSSGGMGSFTGGFLLGSLLGGSRRRSRSWQQSVDSSGSSNNQGSQNTNATGSSNDNSTGNSSQNRKSSGIGCLIVLIIFICLVGVFLIMSMPKQASLPGEYYEDQTGWIQSAKTLRKGMAQFYGETEVQPYVLFVAYDADLWNGSTLDSTAADAYLEEYFEAHFTDSGHFLLAYFQCQNDSRQMMNGEFRIQSDSVADTVLDTEAQNVFWGYLEQYYNDTSYSVEEMLSNTFADTADNVTDQATNGWDFARVAMIVLLVIAVVVAIVVVVRIIARRNKEKEEYVKDILDKPLETFGEDTSELEKKYAATEETNKESEEKL